MNETWDEIVGELKMFDPTDQARVPEAHAYLSILEQILFASSSTST